MLIYPISICYHNERESSVNPSIPHQMNSKQDLLRLQNEHSSQYKLSRRNRKQTQLKNCLMPNNSADNIVLNFSNQHDIREVMRLLEYPFSQQISYMDSFLHTETGTVQIGQKCFLNLVYDALCLGFSLCIQVLRLVQVKFLDYLLGFRLFQIMLYVFFKETKFFLGIKIFASVFIQATKLHKSDCKTHRLRKLTN